MYLQKCSSFVTHEYLSPSGAYWRDKFLYLLIRLPVEKNPLFVSLSMRLSSAIAVCFLQLGLRDRPPSLKIDTLRPPVLSQDNKMPRTFFSTKLFKKKSSHEPSLASSANKQSALPSFQKLKESCRTRVHTLKASLRSRTATPQLGGKDDAASELDISQCLPLVDDIGADLGLTFSHHELRQASTLSSSPSEGSQVGSGCFQSGRETG